MKHIVVIVTIAISLTLGMSVVHAQGVPGLEFLQIPADASIGQVLAQLYIFGLGFVALAAFVMLTIGGIQYMIAGDRDPSEAKSRIKNAIYGLLLALSSYLILKTINPDLVNIAKLQLPEIKKVQVSDRTGIECTLDEQGSSKECGGKIGITTNFICSVRPGQTTGVCAKIDKGQPTQAELQSVCITHNDENSCAKDTTHKCQWTFGQIRSLCNSVQ